MARFVTRTETGPMEITEDDLDGESLWLCQCGLSGDWPHCDGSHAHTRSEEDGKPYAYHRETPNGALVAKQGIPRSLKEANPRPNQDA